MPRLVLTLPTQAVWERVMDKDFWQSFMRFLDEASATELQDRLKKTQAIVDAGLRDPDVKLDSKRIIRFLEQEIMARSSTGK